MEGLPKYEAVNNPVPYRSVLSVIDQAVAVLARERIIYANASLCAISGKNRGEILGRLFLDLVHEKDRPLVDAYLKNYQSSGSEGVRFRVRREAISDRDARLQVAPIQLQGIYADSPGICCFMTDITDEVDRVVELHRENRRLRSLIDDTEIVVMAFAPYDCYDVLLVNRYVEALLGCSVKDIMSGREHLFNFVHPDHLGMVTEFYNGFPDIHENECLEYLIVSRDGRQKWVRDTGNSLFVERGHGIARRIDHTIVDVSEQKKREIELEKERSKLESIIENSTDMIYRVDRDGNFLDLNPAGKNLLGIEDSPGGQSILNFYVDVNEREFLLKQLREKGYAQHTAKWKIPDGRIIDVVINAVTEARDVPDSFSYQGIVHNVTKTLEVQKIESVKKMCGGLSDKINTPLMTISMNIQMLKDILQASHVDIDEMSRCLDDMEKAYFKITGPMEIVREKYWKIEEVSDGAGETIYEIHEKAR